MRQDHLSYTRLLKAAVVGAVIGLLFDLAVTLATSTARAFTVAQLPSAVAFLLVGFAAGWLFELFKAQAEVTDQSMQSLADMQQSVERLTRKITYQDLALTMLIDAPRHNEALSELIKASINDNFRSIPDVGVAAYLRVLSLAINHAERYEGIHRNPFRWYRDTDAGYYLNALREKPMTTKTRLVLIDDDDLEAMRQDLADPAVMAYYWQHTGNVETYWMSVSDFRMTFPGRDVPRDLALYDRQLLVAYDESKLILKFDVVRRDAGVCRLFDDVTEMIARHTPGLKRVEPTRGGVSPLPQPSTRSAGSQLG
jgi:hypothetical protein